MSRPVELIAHRGANREAPENTLPAFRRALELGVDGIELDVQVTKEGVPVVHHDPMVTAAASPVPISSLTLAELRSLSEAPSLDEVLDLVNGRCRVYVEIKAPAATEAVVPRLKSRRTWCAIHSFDHRVATRAATLDRELTIGILLVSYLIDVVAAMRAASARDVWQHADYVDRALVDQVQGAGGRLIAWTVNDADRARAFVELGVDAICTDVPRELLPVTRPTSS